MFKKQIFIGVLLVIIVILPVVFSNDIAVVNAANNKSGIIIPKNTGLSEDTFAVILDRVLNWMLMIFVIISIIAFVITGLQFIFSFGGASGTQESAKKNLTYTIIAIFIVGGALIILNTVVGLLGDAPTGSVSNSNVDHYGKDPVPVNNSSIGGSNAGGYDRSNNDYQAGEFDNSSINGAEEIPAYEPGPFGHVEEPPAYEPGPFGHVEEPSAYKPGSH